MMRSRDYNDWQLEMSKLFPRRVVKRLGGPMGALFFLVFLAASSSVIIPLSANAAPFNRGKWYGYFHDRRDTTGQRLENGGIGSTNIDAFVAFYRDRLNGAAGEKGKTIASYTVSAMMNGQGAGGDKRLSSGSELFARWENTVRNYASLGKISWVENYEFYQNTYWQDNQDDVAWYDEHDTQPSIIFRSPIDNSIQFVIKRNCANPVGSPTALTSAQWTTIGNSYIKNAGKVGDYDNLTSSGATQAEITAEPGDKLRWYHYVQNNSGYPMDRTVNFQGNRTGGTFGGTTWRSGSASGGPGVNFIVETADHPSGSASPYTLYGVSQDDVGQRLCQREIWQPAAWNNPGQGASNFACANVPYNYDLRPRITTSFSGGTLTEGTTATLDARVQNEGPTKSNGSVDSTMYEFVVRPGQTISPDDFKVNFSQPDDNTFYHQGMTQQDACSDIRTWFGSKIKTNSCKSLGANGGGPITVNGGRGAYGSASSIVDGSNYEPGDRVCRFLVINNISNANAGSNVKRASTPYCLSVGKKPKVQVHGGNLSVGKTFGNGIKTDSLVQTSLASRTETSDVPAESSPGTTCDTTRLRGASPGESTPTTRSQSNYDLYPVVTYCGDETMMSGDIKKVVQGTVINLDARVINKGNTPNPQDVVDGTEQGEHVPNTVYAYTFTKDELANSTDYNKFMGAFTGSTNLPDNGFRANVNYSNRVFPYVQTYYEGGGPTGCNAWVRVKLLNKSTNDSCSVAIGGNGGQFWRNNDYNYITNTGNGKVEIATSSYNPGDRICYFTAIRKFNNQYNWTTAAGLEGVADGEDSRVSESVRKGTGRHSWVRRISMPTCVDIIANQPTTVTTSKLFGSWVEYGIFASNSVTGTASGSGLNVTGGSNSPNQTNWSKLTYGNNGNGTSECTSEFGCYTHGDTTLPDPSLRYPISTSTPRVSGAISVDSLPNDVVTSDAGNITLTGGNVPRRKSTVINAPNANVHISGNITYESGGLAAASDLPQLIVIARNITIADSVGEINAWLVAKPQGDNDGIINTCTSADNPGNNDRLIVTECSQGLRVNGPVVSSRLILRRTAGSENGDRQGDPAEIFNLRPDVYLWAYDQARSSSNLRTTSIRELPPRW